MHTVRSTVGKDWTQIWSRRPVWLLVQHILHHDPLWEEGVNTNSHTSNWK